MQGNIQETTINISADKLPLIFGELDRNVSIIEERFAVRVFARGETLRIVGENTAPAERTILKLSELWDSRETVTENDLTLIMLAAENGDELDDFPMNSDCLFLTNTGKPVAPKTAGQKKYVAAIRDNTVTFGVGPAGTGKTYLAVAAASKSFKNRDTSRIILTRPAVEAGEKLGFLPGGFAE
jgi:phosphate starvation-inducible PhoH-like protein